MKYYLNFLILFLICFQSFGQNDSSKKEEVFEIFDVSELAEFKGGEEGLTKFIAEEVKYPKKAIKNHIEGVVNIVFVVDKKGNVKDIQIIGKKLGYGLEEEAIRVIKMTSGKWKPAIQRGKKVNVRYRLPIRFQLN